MNSSLAERFFPTAFVLAFALALSGHAQNLAGDEALSKILIEGEGWQEVASGYQLTDAACADAEGNFYFTDAARGTTVNRISPDGKVSVFLNDTPRISGMKFGPDGRLYACVGQKKQIVALEIPSGKMTVIAENLQPNDLVVTRNGNIYLTETGKHQVTLIEPGGKVRAVDNSVKAPNGITLSPDQGTLAVSDYAGTNVWTYRIESDGSLSAAAPYMTMRAPVSKPEVAAGDGMTTDAQGRYYVTSAMGVQMFDWTGRMGGVLARPQNKGMVSVAFAGPGLEYLYVCCSDKVYRRKTKTTGIPPARASK